MEQIPILLVKDEKLKDPTNVANNFFITITKILNIQQIKKRDTISIPKDSFPGNFSSIKIIQINVAEIKSKIRSLKIKVIRV